MWILPEEETHGIKLVAASRMRSLKNARGAPTDAKDERDVEISVAWENPAQSARSKFQERNQKEAEKDEPQTKESDNDHFHRKKEDETK